MSTKLIMKGRLRLVLELNAAKRRCSLLE